MRVGIVVPQHLEDPPVMIDTARRAAEAGIDSVWVADHLWGRRDPRRPILEGWTALAAVAATAGIGDSMRLGVLVARVGLRNPRLLAAMVRTLSSIAGGRFVLGLGVGDDTVIEEQAAYGMPMAPLQQRVAELHETIDLLRSECPEVPLVVGGGSRPVMEAAVKAGGWNLWGEVDVFVERLADLRSMPGGEAVEATWAGSMPDAEGYARLAEAGASEVIVPVGAASAAERIEGLVGLRGHLQGRG
jgi:hypothetical protein